MKIVFATDSLARGGKERQLSILFSNLSKESVGSIWVKNFTSDNNYLLEYNIDRGLIKNYKGVSDFYTLIKKEKPDLIFTWDAISSLYGLMFSPFFSYKLMNGSIRHGIRAKKISHFFRSFIAWLSPVVIANSVSGLRANNIKHGDSNHVLYNGIDPKFIYTNKRQNKEFLVKKIFPSYNQSLEVVFISVANFNPYKDYFSILNALSEIKEQVPFRYIIIGDGPLRKEIENKIDSFDLKDRIVLLGTIENVKDYLQISDILIHSSKGEGISNSILEAMHSGLPIIASNVGGVPETIFPDYSRLFDYMNTEQLKQHLLNSKLLLNDYDHNNKSYQEHLHKFSVDTMIGNFNSIIKKILKK